MEIVIIGAVAQNRVIGNKGKIPWHISEDLKHFKRVTLNHPVIMGRVTYEEIINVLGKPLPERVNIVISRTLDKNKDDIVITNSVEEAIEEAKKHSDRVYVIGGQKIYEQTIALADRLEITKVHQDFEGDAFFPEIHMEEWKEVAKEDKENDGIKYSFVSYERIK